MRLLKYSLIVFCLGIFSVVTYGQDRAVLQDLLQSMSKAEKMKVLEYAKQQEKSIEQQILEILDRLPEGNQELILEYAKAVYQEKNAKGRRQAGVVDAVDAVDHEGHNHKPVNPQLLTVMEFDKVTENFGTVQEGSIVERTFTFTNTGTKPLVISNARGSCGCTVPEWPRKPIAPGRKGTIRVKFNTNKKVGTRNQVVTIVANTDPKVTTLSLKGKVLKGK